MASIACGRLDGLGREGYRARCALLRGLETLRAHGLFSHKSGHLNTECGTAKHYCVPGRGIGADLWMATAPGSDKKQLRNNRAAALALLEKNYAGHWTLKHCLGPPWRCFCLKLPSPVELVHVARQHFTRGLGEQLVCGVLTPMLHTILQLQEPRWALRQRNQERKDRASGLATLVVAGGGTG